MKKMFTVCIFLFFCSLRDPAQSNLPEFGNFTNSEINLKECPFEKDAEAVVIFDDASGDYDDDHHLITTRRIRIKILNERGLDRATIEIPFYAKDEFEFIRNIEAVSFTDNNFYTLNKKS